MKFTRIVSLSAAGLLAVISIGARGEQPGTSAAAEDHKTKAVVDTQGNLRVPTEYRTSYQYLGSWAVAAKESQGSKELHIVYASPGAVAAYRQNGRFSDGAVLVKEVYQTSTQPMSTGIVSRAGALQGWFVMVKESKDTHPDNQLWGDGWAWSWFDAGDPVKTTSNNYRLQCLPCHEPARGTDLIYVQGYPGLNRAP
jgi:hypothetical protein